MPTTSDVADADADADGAGDASAPDEESVAQADDTADESVVADAPAADDTAAEAPAADVVSEAPPASTDDSADDSADEAEAAAARPRERRCRGGGRRRSVYGRAGVHTVTALRDRHDVLLADLDGTLYRGPVAVPGAVEAVRAAAEQGCRTAYVTNNASRRPADVAAHLAELGFPATTADVATSSQAAAAMLAAQLPAGASVLVVGTEALADEVSAVGLTPVREAAGAVAVVQGHNPETGWPQLAEATVALRAGALWVACNVDATLPTERGLLPGNGSMVAALRTATGLAPQVAGKPAPTLLLAAARRTGAAAPLVIGDRLDTDIEGGRAAGLPTLLVLTGVSTAADLLAAPPAQRADLVAADLAALTEDAESVQVGPQEDWSVTRSGDGLVLSGAGDPFAALRALCAAHWSNGGGAVTVTADGAGAASALRTLRLGADAPGSATVAEDATAPGAAR